MWAPNDMVADLLKWHYKNQKTKATTCLGIIRRKMGINKQRRKNPYQSSVLEIKRITSPKVHTWVKLT